MMSKTFACELVGRLLRDLKIIGEDYSDARRRVTQRGTKKSSTKRRRAQLKEFNSQEKKCRISTIFSSFLRVCSQSNELQEWQANDLRQCNATKLHFHGCSFCYSTWFPHRWLLSWSTVALRCLPAEKRRVNAFNFTVSWRNRFLTHSTKKTAHVGDIVVPPFCSIPFILHSSSSYLASPFNTTATSAHTVN